MKMNSVPQQTFRFSHWIHVSAWLGSILILLIPTLGFYVEPVESSEYYLIPFVFLLFLIFVLIILHSSHIETLIYDDSFLIGSFFHRKQIQFGQIEGYIVNRFDLQLKLKDKATPVKFSLFYKDFYGLQVFLEQNFNCLEKNDNDHVVDSYENTIKSLISDPDTDDQHQFHPTEKIFSYRKGFIVNEIIILLVVATLFVGFEFAFRSFGEFSDKIGIIFLRIVVNSGMILYGLFKILSLIRFRLIINSKTIVQRTLCRSTAFRYSDVEEVIDVNDGFVLISKFKGKGVIVVDSTIKYYQQFSAPLRKIWTRVETIKPIVEKIPCLENEQVYEGRFKTRRQLVSIVSILLIVSTALFYLFIFGASNESITFVNSLLLAFLSSGFPLVLVVLCFRSRNDQLVLRSDELELTLYGRTKVIKYTELRALKEINNQGNRSYKLALKDLSKEYVNLGLKFSQSEEIVSFFKTLLPVEKASNNISGDELELVKSHFIDYSEKYTEKDTLNKDIKRLQKTSIFFLLLSFVVTYVGIYITKKFSVRSIEFIAFISCIYILTLYFWGLIWRYKEIAQYKRLSHFSMIIFMLAFIYPLLLFGAYENINIAYNYYSLSYSILCGVCILNSFFYNFYHFLYQDKFKIFGMQIYFVLTLFVLIPFINCSFDQSVKMVVQVKVVAKQATRSEKNNSRTHYSITLDDFENFNETIKFPVPLSNYRRVNVGDKVEVHVRSGLLNFPWCACVYISDKNVFPLKGVKNGER